MGGHSDRVGCLDWNQHILASGGREGDILLHDVRVAEHQVRQGGDILLHDVRVAEHQVGGGNIQWNKNSLYSARLTTRRNR